MIILNLIGFVIVLCTFTSQHGESKEREQLISAGKLEEKDAIKYDGNSQKNYFIMFVISIVLAGANVMPFALYSYDGWLSHIILTGTFIIIFGVVAIYSMVKYISAGSYLKKIKRSGFIVPDDAKSYEYDIKKLMRKDELLDNNPPEKRDKTTLVYACLYLTVFSICEIYNICFKFGNPQYGVDAYDLVWILAVLDLFWLINAIVTFVKSDNTTYKNPKENIRGKKNRASYAAMAGILIIFGAFTIFGKYTAKSMAEYIFRTHYAEDLSMCDSVRYALQKEYDEGNIPDSVIEDLQEGIDFLTYTDSQEFTNVILKMSGFDSCEEMSESIHSPRGVPEIIVRLTDDKVEVELTNIYEPHYKY